VAQQGCLDLNICMFAVDEDAFMQGIHAVRSVLSLEMLGLEIGWQCGQSSNTLHDVLILKDAGQIDDAGLLSL